MAKDASGIYRPDFLPPDQLPWQQGMNPDQQVNIQPAASAFQDRFMKGSPGGGPAAPDHAPADIPGPAGHGGEGLPAPEMPAHGMSAPMGAMGADSPLAKLGAGGKAGGMASL